MQSTASIFRQPIIWVAALGYFVDIYDLLLFSIIRIPSLTDLGVANLGEVGMLILNTQMFGLLIGGILWGVLGDKLGRTKVLFYSIALYSIGNIANGFVTNGTQYAWIRFFAGIGLAGELGAGITLVSELLPKEKRGIGTSLVAGVGLTGAVLAFFISQWFDWRTCYFIGGGLGLLLLFVRLSVFESGLYKTLASNSKISKGNFLMLFATKERFMRYLRSILIGLPTWFVVGILISFSPEFARQLGITESIDPGIGIMVSYSAIAVGDVAIGLLSQKLQSRKQAMHVFYLITMIGMVVFFTASTALQLYISTGIMGFGTGFWAVFVTIGAENFGTNLRATAATSIPNMVRGSLNGITALFLALNAKFTYVNAGIVTAVAVMLITYWAISGLQETFGRDLDFYEE
ncbi:MAG: MFS transporter [Schleiferiaceae bacterium]|jgi:MFS family permease|nr:MFS transporter [Schleiferiaceae bacterium]MDG1312743.1 MFS transporter [Schleiferiaceae bacterium]MDG1919217.1 MFS transporter [Schleiferiaceae bacterium]MDG2110038.1 MFS transporter [Schleiferiaceae bacterium]CAI8392493.1 MAG: Putative niacin/nicotinamide transporter NaiP [Flavobacteriales bacterium UBA4585]